MEELKKDLQEAIKKHLPEQLCTEMKKIIEQNELMKKQIKQKDETLKDKTRRITELEKENKDLSFRAATSDSLIKFEHDLNMREQRMNVEILELKLAESEKRNELSKEYVGLIFKSPVYRKNVHRSELYTTKNQYDTNGNYIEIRLKDGENTETIETEN